MRLHPGRIHMAAQPILDLRFADVNSLDSRITLTGGANRTYFDALQDLQDGTTNVARFDHLLSDGTSLGLSVWEARTNGIRNNTMAGASAGTPGTLPTNWASVDWNTTRTIVGTGTENGISYIDVRFAGTPNGNINLSFEIPTGIDALTGETWSFSSYFSIVAGDATNIAAIRMYQIEMTEAGGTVLLNSSSITLSSTLTRFVYSETLSGGVNTAHVQPRLFLIWTSGAIDITLRIGLPQEEEGTGASPVIKTTNAAVTATASLVSIPPKAIKTMFIAARTGASSGTQVLWQRDDGTENNRIRIERNSSDEIHFIVTDGGVEQANLNLGTVADNTDFKVAPRFDTNDFAGSLDGATVVEDTGGTIPTITADFLGVDASENYWNSTIAHIKGWTQGLDNLLLRDFTARS